METKDVDNILDIPNIAYWVGSVFDLNLYDAGDKDLYYECFYEGVCCDVVISLKAHPRIIDGKKKLSDLIMLDDIDMFEMRVGKKTKTWDSELGAFMSDNIEPHQSHWYRPFLAKEEREY
jgi:hypothetical protein